MILVCILAMIFQSTPLMRGETFTENLQRRHMCISIHSPHARGDLWTVWLHSVHKKFQSTPLMRGETFLAGLYPFQPEISIHSPHARGDSYHLSFPIHIQISIHSPHARGDFWLNRRGSRFSNFNPLPSCEGRRLCIPQFRNIHHISIHSPHARGDSINLQKSFWIQGSLYNKNITAHFF